MHYHWEQTSAKKRTWLLWTMHINQKISVNLIGLVDSGWLERQQYDLHSFFWILWTFFQLCSNTEQIFCSVLEQSWKKKFKNNTQNMGFVNRMDQNVTKYWYSNEKMAVVPVCLNGSCCYSLCGVLYHINKDKGHESLPLLSFQRHVVSVIFLKYSKEGRLFSSHLGIPNIPSDVCYDGTEYYHVQSEHRRIQNPFKHLRESVSA